MGIMVVGRMGFSEDGRLIRMGDCRTLLYLIPVLSNLQSSQVRHLQTKHSTERAVRVTIPCIIIMTLATSQCPTPPTPPTLPGYPLLRVDAIPNETMVAGHVTYSL